MIDIYTFVEAVWLMWSAYGANGLCMLAKGKRPIDGNRTFWGKPVFGPGKTWEGLILGVIIAIAVASFQMFAFPFLPWDLSPVPLDIVAMFPLLGLVIGMGAMVGNPEGKARPPARPARFHNRYVRFPEFRDHDKMGMGRYSSRAHTRSALGCERDRLFAEDQESALLN